jgi:hypothetical protein
MSENKRDTEPHPQQSPGSMRTIPYSKQTIPHPERVSAERLAEPPPGEIRVGGGRDIETSAERGAAPAEAQAREFISVRFAAAGYALSHDFAFQAPEVAVVLDGYDPIERVGYAYISHRDADVVSDISAAEEIAFAQMAKDGTAQVLIVHDRDIDSFASLEACVDQFLARLHQRQQR